MPVFIQSKLHNKTFKLINKKLDESKNRNSVFFEISNATGLSIPWLDYFARNPDKSAAVNKVEALYNYLNDKKLKA